MASTWISYNDLAWTEDWLANPEEYKDEVMVYIDLIKSNSSSSPITLLHLGCGAGGHDTFFKQHFTVTGVDLSKGMLKKACIRHPEIEYIEGDMKTLQLNRQFDVVSIPDSIDYMVSEDDLFQAITNAVFHLKIGGVLLVVAKTKETFQNNNFAYTGEKEGVNVTLLENNYINIFKPNTYEATFMYLIRKQGELSIHTENQVLGLFSQATWENMFNNAGLTMQKATLSGIYEKYILDEGEYPLTIFIGKK
ncbi:MAG: class I SAM-dependent methyltransferase [Ignavibacteriaceae bacterium]